MLRGSVAAGTAQVGGLRIGTSFGNVDTGVAADRHGLEAKLFGNGAAIRDDKLELCFNAFCASIDPSPLIRALAAAAAPPSPASA